MYRALLFAVIGYLSGSLLFARYFTRFFSGHDVVAESSDSNPGTFNAFKHGGFMCGTLTLSCDLLKAFLPVYIYRRGNIGSTDIWLSLVIAAPVIGHILPLYHHFRGGKGIAASFGVMLGLFPEMRPAIVLAIAYLLFSCLIIVNPHYYRTLISYTLAICALATLSLPSSILIGTITVSIAVIIKHLASAEVKEKLEVRPVWRH